MNVYAYVRKGTNADKKQCDDRVLIGSTVLDRGYHEITIESDSLVVAVSDGVGGHAGGWKAAELGLQETAALKDVPFEDMVGMIACIQHANDKVLSEAAVNIEFRRMAATLSVLRICKDAAVVLHLGDSRVYQLRTLQGHSVFRQLTRDQNLLNQWMQLQEYSDYNMSEEELKRDRAWSQITTYLGMSTDKIAGDILVVDNIGVSGCFLLTSDGVHDFLPTGRLTDILKLDISPKEKLELLADEARANGSADDQSIILVIPD